MKIILLSLLLFFLTFSYVDARSTKWQKNFPRMIRGSLANLANWPFIANLKFRNSDAYFKTCSASAVNSVWLITAAHCVNQMKDNPRHLEVRFPRADMSSYAIQNVSEIQVNPNFKRNPYSYDYDIALIKLTGSIPSNKRTVTLPTPGNSATNCKSAGWGSTKTLNSLNDVRTKNYNISNSLQEIPVPLVPWNQCNSPFNKNHTSFAINNTKVLCGGAIADHPPQKGGCIGDSGSPLVCNTSNGKVLHAIMLGGNPKCIPGKDYMFFTDVAKHLEWINSII